MNIPNPWKKISKIQGFSKLGNHDNWKKPYLDNKNFLGQIGAKLVLT